MSDSATIVQKLWNYCNVLRDDGLSYQDYIEQLTFLLFLKMADEQTQPPFNRPAIVPDGPGLGSRWSALTVMTWRCSTATSWLNSASSRARSASSSARRRTRSRTRPS